FSGLWNAVHQMRSGFMHRADCAAIGAGRWRLTLLAKRLAVAPCAGRIANFAAGSISPQLRLKSRSRDESGHGDCSAKCPLWTKAEIKTGPARRAVLLWNRVARSRHPCLPASRTFEF